MDRDANRDRMDRPVDDVDDDREGHATTGGAAAAGAVTGGAIGLAGGPVGAAVGAVGGAIIGAVAERIMHGGDEHEHEGGDEDHWTGDHDHTGDDDGHDHRYHHDLGYGLDRYQDRMDRIGSGTGTREEGTTMQVREEELVARKTPVETGEVVVRKEVTAERETMAVPVTREEVEIERRPVDRRPADRRIGEGDTTMRVPVREEEVTLEKRPVVTEEVSIGKRVTQDTETVSGTVRKEHARVEREGDADVPGEGMTGTDHRHTFDTAGRCGCGLDRNRMGTS